MTTQDHTPPRRPSVSLPEKIIALWVVFLLGTLFHTQLALIPLFHGLDVNLHEGQTATSISEIEPLLWLMLLFFIIPMVAISTTLFTQTRRYRIGHFGLTVLYSLLNLSHLVADLLVAPIAWYQIALMLLLFLVGLVLNVVAYQWWRQPAVHRRSLGALT